jgi:opacity protein-like surface antigen
VRVRNLLIFFALSLSFLHAQRSRVEIFGGYQHVGFSDPFQIVSGNGWNAGAAFHFVQWFGLKADFSGSYGNDTRSSGTPLAAHKYTYTFGPVVSVHHFQRLTPFGEVLFGGYHETLHTYQNVWSGFALLVGGGVDVGLTPRVALRLGPFDWQHLRSPGPAVIWNANTARVGAGVVFRF